MRGLTDVLRDYHLVGEIPKSTLLALKKQPTLAELPAVFPPLIGQGKHLTQCDPKAALAPSVP